MIKDAPGEGVFQTVITADMQTAGRGRRGRRFESLSGDSLYMSVIRRLPVAAGADGIVSENTGLITIATAVAVCRALVQSIDCENHLMRPPDSTGLGIKWVNDVIFAGRKVCGILVEVVGDGVVIGIGTNINVPEEAYSEFGADVAYIAGSVTMSAEARAAFPDLLASQVIELYGKAQREPGEVMDEYRALEITTGREITVTRIDGGVTPATALRIEGSGGLTVAYPDGSTETLITGEVSIKL
jgi:BirA family biotin operon repressor/biotin-[acetyl-CoA-carboxylase] ligase